MIFSKLIQRAASLGSRAPGRAQSHGTFPRTQAPDPSPSGAQRRTGFTLIEMVLATSLLAILIMMATPVIRNNLQRQREIELRQALRQIRRAIDDYHDRCKAGEFQADNDLNKICYPPDMDTLLDGVDKHDANRTKIRFLRRLPIDPMTGEITWGLRSTQDDADSTSWGGDNVWDVYSLSTAQSLDGKTHYNEW